MAEDPNRPPLSDEPDGEEAPGVVPGGAERRPSGDAPEEGFAPVSEIIVEVAPNNPLFGEGERRTEQIVEVAPDDPAERRPGPSPYEPGPIEEVAPEVQPSETEPAKPTDPSEVVTEVAPERIVEVAPERIVEVAPERIVEVAPERPSPYEPGSDPIEEIAPEVQPEVAPEVQPSETEPSRRREPSEVIPEVAPEVAPER
jgi:hypothetical protein